MAAKNRDLFAVYPWYLGFFMSIGDHFADLLGSFIKRRINIKSGGALPLYDQGSWMVTGLAIAIPFVLAEPNLWFYVVALIVVTPLLHFIFGFVAYGLRLKDVWY
jgi:CDP-2,3-bis-(O-geranylgeranyl)-sn-glycerol synthase